MKTASSNRGLFTVLLLLVVVVVLPTACVLWFMTAAMRNERLAVRQRLTAAYRAQLVAVERELRASWEDRQAELSTTTGETPSLAFARLVRDGVADALVVRDANGDAYPRDAAPVSDPAADSPEWSAAARLEFASGDPAAAAEAYAAIAGKARDIDLEARARQAEARCRLKARNEAGALVILTETLGATRLGAAVDPQGRLVVPDAWLLALRLLEPGSGAFSDVAGWLQKRLARYDEPALPAAQRRFLMRELGRLAPDMAVFDTLAAEDLAARYLDSDPVQAREPGLRRSGLDGVWQLPSRDGRIVALFREASVLPPLAAGDPGDVSYDLAPPGSGDANEEVFLSTPAGGLLPGWRLDLRLSDRGLIDTAADGQITAYLWTGMLVVLGIVALVALIARQIGRQMRVTRLKNDLIATVTHELKTPLASMRLLVETLLDGRPHDQQQVREYLELISKENLRLSRLIGDFLTFSRMERNKEAFEKVRLEPEEVVEAAADVVRPRFDTEHCRFDVDVPRDLPAIVGDSDALATVLVNLLENAWKYSDDDKHIVLRAYAKNGDVCFEVQDNGIGLSRRATKRIFDRFYQTDRDLSRAGGGVGLGLAIVKFIVNAHDGTIDVESRPGEGSTFEVRLPAVQVS